jgi:hypothetical protein
MNWVENETLLNERKGDLSALRPRIGPTIRMAGKRPALAARKSVLNHQPLPTL